MKPQLISWKEFHKFRCQVDQDPSFSHSLGRKGPQERSISVLFFSESQLDIKTLPPELLLLAFRVSKSRFGSVVKTTYRGRAQVLKMLNGISQIGGSGLRHATSLRKPSAIAICIFAVLLWSCAIFSLLVLGRSSLRIPSTTNTLNIPALTHSLLLHISFFHHPKPETPHCDSGVTKGTKIWNDAMFSSLIQQLWYCEGYSEMDTVVVFVDTNDAMVPKEYGTKVPSYMKFERVKLNFHVHENLSHPFHLTSRHRKHMADRLEEFTHFMYTEVDTVMPPATFARSLHEADTLWKLNPPAVRTYTRMCSDGPGPSQESFGFFDNRSPTPAASVFQVGQQPYIRPKSTYSACWLYSRDILESIMQTTSWDTADAVYTTASGLNAIRELQAKPLHEPSVVPLDDDFKVPSDAYVWHLGGSGKLYCSQYCGKAPLQTFITKQFAYLINARRGRPLSVDEVLASPKADVFVLSWDELDPLADMYLPNSTFHSGRNAIYDLVRKREKAQGWEYEYYVFLDEDALKLDCDKSIVTSSERATLPGASYRFDYRAQCWRAFEERLLRDEPAVAGPRMIDTPEVMSDMQTASEISICVFDFDAQFNAFKRTAARKLLPYLEFQGISWTSGTEILRIRASTLFLGDVLIYNQFSVPNKEHKLYPGSGKLGGNNMFEVDIQEALEFDKRIFLCSSLTPPAFKISEELSGKYRLADCSTAKARRAVKQKYAVNSSSWSAIKQLVGHDDDWCVQQNCIDENKTADSREPQCLRPKVEKDQHLIRANMENHDGLY